MDLTSVVFLLLNTACCAVLANELAKFGWSGIILNGFDNHRVNLAVMWGAINIFMFTGLRARYGLETSAWDHKIIIAFSAIVIPGSWYLLKKHLLLLPGQTLFNQAIAIIRDLAEKHYVPGKILPREETLSDDSLPARIALHKLERAMSAQKRGKLVNSYEERLAVTPAEREAGQYHTACGFCGTQIYLPLKLPLGGITRDCLLCRTEFTLCEADGGFWLKTVFPKLKRIVLDDNRFIVAVIQETMALLFRMTNNFGSAGVGLEASQRIIENLLVKEPDNPEYLYQKSLNLYRLAEISQVQGKISEAKKGYEEAKKICEIIKNEEGIQINAEMIAEIT